MYKLQKQACNYLYSQIDRSKRKLEILTSIKHQTKVDGTVYRDYDNFCKNFTSKLAYIYNRSNAEYQLLLIRDKAMCADIIIIKLDRNASVEDKITCAFTEIERLKRLEENHLKSLANQLDNVEDLVDLMIDNVRKYNALISQNKEIAEALHLYRNLNINDDYYED